MNTWTANLILEILVLFEHNSHFQNISRKNGGCYFSVLCVFIMFNFQNNNARIVRIVGAEGAILLAFGQ